MELVRVKLQHAGLFRMGDGKAAGKARARERRARRFDGLLLRDQDVPDALPARFARIAALQNGRLRLHRALAARAHAKAALLRPYVILLPVGRAHRQASPAGGQVLRLERRVGVLLRRGAEPLLQRGELLRLVLIGGVDHLAALLVHIDKIAPAHPAHVVEELLAAVAVDAQLQIAREQAVEQGERLFARQSAALDGIDGVARALAQLDIRIDAHLHAVWQRERLLPARGRVVFRFRLRRRGERRLQRAVGAVHHGLLRRRRLAGAQGGQAEQRKQPLPILHCVPPF